MKIIIQHLSTWIVALNSVALDIRYIGNKARIGFHAILVRFLRRWNCKAAAQLYLLNAC